MDGMAGRAACVEHGRDGQCGGEMALPARLGARGTTSGQEFPQDRAQALTLLDGQRIAVNLAFDFAADKQRVLMTPPWTMVSTVLKKDPRAPDGCAGQCLRAQRTGKYSVIQPPASRAADEYLPRSTPAAATNAAALYSARSGSVRTMRNPTVSQA
jgi:hypothetical protein